MAQPVLYGTKLCPYVVRTRLVLAANGVNYAFKQIDLLNKPKGFQPEISPYGKVPVLDDAGKIIYESAAINQYVDDKWGHGKLMGGDAYQRALHRVWTHWCNRYFSTSIYHLLFEQDKSKFPALTKELQDTLAFLDARIPKLQQQGGCGPFLLGTKDPAFSDVMLAPFFHRLQVIEALRGPKAPSATNHPNVAKLISNIDGVLLNNAAYKDIPMRKEELVPGYEPFATGKVKLDPNTWSY